MAEKRPQVSIVIPAYNEEKNLPDCLESLTSQDFQGDYEIIVVDNNSLDRTAAVALQYPVTLITCTKKGVFFARAAGAMAARGEIIAQADADTIYPENWLTSIVKQFEKHKEAVAVGGPFLYRDPPWWAPVERYLKLFFNFLSLTCLGRPFIVSAANLAFRRWAFLLVGGYNPYGYAADQFDLATRLSRVGRVIYDDRIRIRTSARTMKKPFVFALVDLLVHMGRYARYELQAPFNFVRSLPARMHLSPGRILVTGLIVVPLTFFAYGYFIPASPVFGTIYYEGKTSEKVIALTFDDGPNEPYTSQILSILKAYGVKATFFTTGYNVEEYPETARRIVAEGHILGNHSYSHDANHALSMQGIRDLTLAEERIHEVIGLYPGLYRPPHGRKTPWELQYVQEQGLVAVNWSIATPELAGRTPEQMAEDVVSKAAPGGIVLLHDGYGLEHGTEKSNKSATVVALPIIIKQLSEKGYGFVTVPELINVQPYH